jgi:hypothetical protein
MILPLEDPLDQTRSRKDLPRGIKKCGQQLELDTRKIEPSIAAAGSTRAEVHDHTVDCEPAHRNGSFARGENMPVTAAQDHPNTSQKLPGVERLWQVVVRTGIKTQDTV